MKKKVPATLQILSPITISKRSKEIPIKKNCIEATKNTVIIIILRYASFTSALALFILDKIGYVTR